jgi:hypothetical protein
MPRWDDPRGPRPDPERDRWRRDEMRDRGGRSGEESRSFGERNGLNDRDAARYDRDRVGYGRRDEDAGAAGYARRPAERARGAGYSSEGYGDQGGVAASGPPYAYGQEYGVESEGGFGRAGPSAGPNSGQNSRQNSGQNSGPNRGSDPGWGFDRDPERRRNFDFDDPGVGQSQAGYGPKAQSHPDHEFDPDYLRWRETQMRDHDRDYQDWRRDQHRQYDDEYRRFRGERQRHFGQAFHEWRSQRSAVGGTPDTGIAPGVSGYGDKTALPGGYNAPGAYDKPSGLLDPPGHLSIDPAMSQRGGSSGGSGSSAPVTGGDRSPEFGKEPSQVQASAEGRVQGHEEKSRDHDKDDGKDKAGRH